LRNVVAAVTGVGFVIFFYLAIYLLRMFPIGIIGVLALGISAHVFAPALFVIFTLIWLSNNAGKYRNVMRSFLCGSIFAVAVAVAFCLQWASVDKLVASRYQHTLLDTDTDLPSWIKVAQEIPHNYVAEAYLKGDLVYSLPDGHFDDFGFNIPNRSFDEVRKHDPLIMIAALFSRPQKLNTEERIKILRTSFDARHKTEDRLWSGSDLVTSNVISNIRIWPQFRMAYTEKTITISNTDKTAWGRNQEAIYTFHLPEGGVVTSLSLWIDGVEQKGLLTTKGKADSAYKQIVGVESRDPSVVHWQEGNRVTVRVFPIPENGNRVFKIGVTAPLAYQSGMLRYQNIYFDGPWADDAVEIVRVKWEQQPEAAVMADYEEKGNMLYEQERRYVKDWDLASKAPPLRTNSFSFSGKSYHINLYKPFKKAVNFNKIFLDLNGTWTRHEYDETLNALEGRKVYVYDDGLIEITENNKQKVFDHFEDKQFSIFPLHVIHHPANALLITKSGEKSPEISDVKETPFATQLDEWLARGEKLSVYNIGHNLSSYLKTLKEHRAFVYESGSVQELEHDVRQGIFAGDAEQDNQVVIDNAEITISRTDDTQTSNAPDHFMRLFAYNHLMQQLKTGVFHNMEADTALVQEAQQAYVVTPLSSLIVLETVADYKQFDINPVNNSLQNASMKSTGAVPEPHEWALIILTAVTMIWLTYKHKLRKLWGHS
jgi:XrtN system VIT domain protein